MLLSCSFAVTLSLNHLGRLSRELERNMLGEFYHRVQQLKGSQEKLMAEHIYAWFVLFRGHFEFEPPGTLISRIRTKYARRVLPSCSAAQGESGKVDGRAYLCLVRAFSRSL